MLGFIENLEIIQASLASVDSPVLAVSQQSGGLLYKQPPEKDTGTYPLEGNFFSLNHVLNFVKQILFPCLCSLCCFTTNILTKIKHVLPSEHELWPVQIKCRKPQVSKSTLRVPQGTRSLASFLYYIAMRSTWSMMIFLKLETKS